jgi:hypothetical protein
MDLPMELASFELGPLDIITTYLGISWIDRYWVWKQDSANNQRVVLVGKPKAD